MVVTIMGTYMTGMEDEPVDVGGVLPPIIGGIMDMLGTDTGGTAECDAIISDTGAVATEAGVNDTGGTGCDGDTMAPILLALCMAVGEPEDAEGRRGAGA